MAIKIILEEEGKLVRREYYGQPGEDFISLGEHDGDDLYINPRLLGKKLIDTIKRQLAYIRAVRQMEVNKEKIK